MIASLFASVSILFASFLGLAPATVAEPVADFAPICHETLCYSDVIVEDAFYALEESGFLNDIDGDTMVTFVGYIDAPSFDEALDFQAVQITDNEGTTFVFAYSNPTTRNA